MSIKRPVVLVTGANRGIGLEVSQQIAARGMHVILVGRKLPALEAVAAQFKANGSSAETLLLDATDSTSIQEAAADLAERNHKIQVLINNAGICLGMDQSLLTDPEESLQRSLLVNSYGPLRIVRAFLPFMERNSRIIMVSSGGRAMGDGLAEGWSPAYCSSKTLLNAF